MVWDSPNIKHQQLVLSNLPNWEIKQFVSRLYIVFWNSWFVHWRSFNGIRFVFFLLLSIILLNFRGKCDWNNIKIVTSLAIYMPIHEFSCVNEAQKVGREITQFDPTIGFSTFNQAFGVNCSCDAWGKSYGYYLLFNNMNDARSNCVFKQKQSSQLT